MTTQLTPNEKRLRSAEAAQFAGVLASIDLSECRRSGQTDALLPPDHAAAVEDFLKARVHSVTKCANRALGVPTLV